MLHNPLVINCLQKGVYIQIIHVVMSVMVAHEEKTPQIEKEEVKMTITIIYSHTSNVRDTLVYNKIADHWDVVGASPVGATSTTSSFLA